jgi:glyoxylase-like metal-dependent hydrolase (beta-lactamase superfamily II)
MSLKVKRYLTAVNAANCYLCWCDETMVGMVVDPAEFTAEMEAFVTERDINLTKVLITHSHYDHDGGLDVVRKKYAVEINAAHSYTGGLIVAENDVVPLGNHFFTAYPTTGHTADSLSFVSREIAFVGDAIFAAAVGGTSNRDFFREEVTGIKKYLLAQPNSMILYPGHGPATTVAIERLYNPFFLD